MLVASRDQAGQISIAAYLQPTGMVSADGHGTGTTDGTIFRGSKSPTVAVTAENWARGLVEAALGNTRSLACHRRYVGSQGMKAAREREGKWLQRRRGATYVS